MKLGVDGTKGHKYMQMGIALLRLAFKIYIPRRSLIPSTAAPSQRDGN